MRFGLSGRPSVNAGEVAKLMEELLRRVRESTSGIKQVIPVMSGKGGVGKSLMTASLALAMKELGEDVAILDADLHGPSIPWLMGVVNESMGVAGEGRILPVVADGVGIVSVDLALERKDTPLAWRGPIKTRAILDLLALTDWGRTEYLLVDLPPGTGDEALTILRYLKPRLGGAVLVTIPGGLVKHVVQKAVNFLRIVGAPLLGLVINMAYFRCPVCGTRHDIFGEIMIPPNIKVLAEIPIDPELANHVSRGMLREYFKKESDWKRSVVEAASEILRVLNNRSRT